MSQGKKPVLTGTQTTFSTKRPCNKKEITFEDTEPPCGNDMCYTDPWTLNKGDGTKDCIQDAPSLSLLYYLLGLIIKYFPKIDADEYLYILPNDVLIDEDKVTGKVTGYLLAHIKHKDGDRHIHLFTFNPDNPKKLTHLYCGGYKGAFISPKESDFGDEYSDGKGIYEASLNVVGDKVFIHYASWLGDKSVCGYSLVSEISLENFKTGNTKRWPG